MSVDVLTILNSKGQVPFEVQSHLSSILKHESFRKNEYILRPGEINDKMIFIQKGLIRTFYLKDGVEIGSWFRSEGEFVVSITSFYQEKPSQEYMQALEPTDALYITRRELYQIYRRYPHFAVNALLLTTDVLVELQQRVYAVVNTSAEERYKWLVSNRPDLLTRVQSNYVARFLGITPETFSKVRSTQYKEWPLDKAS